MTVQITPAARACVKERGGGLCELDQCGRQQVVHHRRPRGKGGTWLKSSTSPANLLGLADRCHLRIESDRTWAFGQGLLLTAAEDAERTPVYLRHLYGTGWWLLSHDGFIARADPLVQSGLTHRA